MPLAQLGLNDPLASGDVVDLHFRTIGGTWIKAAQIAFIEWQLRGRKDWQIIRTRYHEKDQVTFTVRVL